MMSANRIVPLSLFLIAALYGCRKTAPRAFPRIIELDTVHAEPLNTQWLTVAQYNVIYIGARTDTIIMAYGRMLSPLLNVSDSIVLDLVKRIKPDYPLQPLSLFTVEWFMDRNFAETGKKNITIQIDTTARIKMYHYMMEHPAYIEAYPVLLTNEGADTIYIGSRNTVPLILEAKDSTGAWRPIEEHWRNKCAVGANPIFLPPELVALTAVPVYGGVYNTELRLSMKFIRDTFYSAPFNGSINHNQFESLADRY